MIIHEFRLGGRVSCGVLMCLLGLLLVRPATAQEWLVFENETSTRLVADAGVGADDPDEKDYAWADLDQDGDIDLVVVRKEGWTTRGRRRNVLFMNEGGVLVDRTAELASASTVTLEETGLTSQGMLDETNDRDVALADVNGDGWLDVVTSTSLSKNGNNKSISHPRIYINLGNDGGGNWQGFIFDDKDRAPTMMAGNPPTIEVEPRFGGVAAGDLDGDGDVDLYFSDYQQGTPDRPADLNDRLWINNGNGYFTDQSKFRMTEQMLDSAFGMATVIADMNRDGFLDVIKDTGLVPPQHVSISYNDPNQEGFFNIYQEVHHLSPYHMTVGDLNNDDWPDMVITDDGDDRYRLNGGPTGNGTLDFGPSYTFAFTGGGEDDGFGGNNLIVDLDNDGWNEVIITDVDVDVEGCNRRTHIYRNLANPPTVTLEEQMIDDKVVGIPTEMLVGTHDVAVFDIDGDGLNDIVFGRCSSTQVWMNRPWIDFEYPLGLPTVVAPNEDSVLQVSLETFGGVEVEPGSPTFYVAIDGGGFGSQPLQLVGGDVYEFTLPGAECLSTLEFYVSAELTGGAEFTDPAGAPGSTFTAVAAAETEVRFQDEMEGDVSDWTVTSQSLDTGEWEQANPNGTINSGNLASPEDDATPDGVMAFVTENGDPGGSSGDADVDGGPTYLITPTIDLTDVVATVSYARWMYWSQAGNQDFLTVDISNDGGQTWVPIPEHTTSDSEQVWENVSFIVGDYVEPTAEVQVRFGVADHPNDSITEAGIDDFQVDVLFCNDDQPCEGDANGDGTVDPLDSGFVLARFGCPVGTGDPSCDAADQNGDGSVDPLDSGFVLARFGTCE